AFTFMVQALQQSKAGVLAFAFMDQALQQPKAVVLVHCAGGVSRSSALVAAFLMRANAWSLADSLSYIRERHPAAAPNYAFIHQLMDLEKTLGVEDRKGDP
ncbi:protein-tyrosine phosphatase-like protein, partial [Baffinella frigidus]